MAWSWSHSSEGIQNAQDNLALLDREKLEIIFAEWRAAQGKHGIINRIHADFNEKRYNRALAYAKDLTLDQLQEFIWEKAEEQAICDNGGFEAWMCPYGCGCHTVPFSSQEELGVDCDDETIELPYTK